MDHTNRDPIQNGGQKAVKDREAFVENVTFNLRKDRGGYYSRTTAVQSQDRVKCVQGIASDFQESGHV